VTYTTRSHRIGHWDIERPLTPWRKQKAEPETNSALHKGPGSGHLFQSIGNRSLVECFGCFPDFPDFSDQIRTRCQDLFARFPTRGCGLGALAFAHELEGLNLPDSLGNASADRRSEHFKSLDDAIGINQESAPHFNAGIFIVDAVYRSHFAAAIGEHGEGNSSLDHFRELIVVPHFVDKVAVHADGENLYTQFFEFSCFFGDRRNLSRSDKGKIAGIEAEYDPLPEVIRQLDVDEFALMIRWGGEIRSLASYFEHGTFLLCWGEWCRFRRCGGWFSDGSPCRPRAASLDFFCHGLSFRIVSHVADEQC
jgi:hypothetical protein